MTKANPGSGKEPKVPATADERPAARRSSAGHATRVRIQQVALELFLKKGYQSTSTRDVAAGLGVQQASLYYHIKNKQELLHGICYSSFVQVIENAEAAVAAAPDARERVRCLLRTHLTTTLAYQKEFSISIMECRALSADYRAEIENLWQRYRVTIFAALDGAKASGVIRSDISNHYLYTAIMDMLNWTVIWYRPHQGLTVPEMDSIFAAIFFEGAALPASKAASQVAVANISRGWLGEMVSILPPTEVNEAHARLLDAACSLFKVKGYYATSMREIGDLLGLQKASLYYYVSGKEDLIYQISKASLENIANGVRTALTRVDGAFDRIYVLIVCHVVCLLQHQNWYAAAHDELHALSAERRVEIVALRDDYEKLLRQTLAEGQAAGILRTDVPAKFLGLVLLGMINCIYPWYQPEIHLTPLELGCLLADLYLNGVSVPETPIEA